MLHEGKPGALRLPLCVRSGEGPDHKGLLYTVLHYISARGGLSLQNIERFLLLVFAFFLPSMQLNNVVEAKEKAPF